MSLKYNDQCWVLASIADHSAADCSWQQHKINVLRADAEPCLRPVTASTLLPSHHRAGSWQHFQEGQALVIRHLAWPGTRRWEASREVNESEQKNVTGRWGWRGEGWDCADLHALVFLSSKIKLPIETKGAGFPACCPRSAGPGTTVPKGSRGSGGVPIHRAV